MPFKYQLTWIQQAKRWRKRYRSQTYYLKTRTSGKRDRAGYLAALAEWERLRNYLDGIGPSPYTETGVLIPDDHQHGEYVSTAPMQNTAASVSPGTAGVQALQAVPSDLDSQTIGAPLCTAKLKSQLQDDPPWIIGTGVAAFKHSQLVVTAADNPYDSERRIANLSTYWLDSRRKMAERGELSVQQWAADGVHINVFQTFLEVNFPQVQNVEDIDATVLTIYRDLVFKFLGSGDVHQIGKITLKKRLGTVSKFLDWLVDKNLLATLPKSMKTYSRVALDSPTPLFYTPDEIKRLASRASERTRLYIMLGLNLGYTQKDIATLEPGMVDWDTRIVTRKRHKTGVPSKARLWPSTMELLAKHRNPKKRGALLLVSSKGTPLRVETINDSGNIAIIDSIGLAFGRLKRQVITDELTAEHPTIFTLKRTGLDGELSMDQWRVVQKERAAKRKTLVSARIKAEPRSFKHLRKSSADQIERTQPDLTEAFLAHAEPGMKRAYVDRHFNELFEATDQLATPVGVA